MLCSDSAGRRLLHLCLVLVMAGCSGGVVRLEKDLFLLDLVPEGQPRGYVEFRLDPDIRNAPNFGQYDAVVACWEVKERPCDLVHPTYQVQVHGYRVSKQGRMRFAAPPGPQRYAIGKHRDVPITVQAGMVTPVTVRVVGQFVERMATFTNTYSGTVVSTTTTTTGPVYGWMVEWQVGTPRPVEARP